MSAGLAAALERLVETDARPVLLIDGGAGSGKTTLAESLAASWPGGGPVQVVGLDELYPGWGGLAAGSDAVPTLITGTGFRTWDWAAGRPGAWRSLDPTEPLVVEGCGALTPASRALAGLALWLEVDQATRRQPRTRQGRRGLRRPLGRLGSPGGSPLAHRPSPRPRRSGPASLSPGRGPDSLAQWCAGHQPAPP